MGGGGWTGVLDRREEGLSRYKSAIGNLPVFAKASTMIANEYKQLSERWKDDVLTRTVWLVDAGGLWANQNEAFQPYATLKIAPTISTFKSFCTN